MRLHQCLRSVVKGLILHTPDCPGSTENLFSFSSRSSLVHSVNTTDSTQINIGEIHAFRAPRRSRTDAERDTPLVELIILTTNETDARQTRALDYCLSLLTDRCDTFLRATRNTSSFDDEFWTRNAFLLVHRTEVPLVDHVHDYLLRLSSGRQQFRLRHHGRSHSRPAEGLHREVCGRHLRDRDRMVDESEQNRSRSRGERHRASIARRTYGVHQRQPREQKWTVSLDKVPVVHMFDRSMQQPKCGEVPARCSVVI